MTTCLLISTLLLAAPAKTPTIQQVQEGWQKQAQLSDRVNLKWDVVRDSRTEELGFQPEELPRPGQLWLDGNRARVDQFCLLVPGRDGRLHPQNRDRAANRHEFQRVLLDEQLEGAQPIPDWHNVSLVVSRRKPLPNDPWGPLVQFTNLGAILATRPEFALGQEKLTVTGQRARLQDSLLPVLKVQREPKVHDEVWVDPQRQYRVVRWLRWTDDEPSGQIDISYEETTTNIPKGWTAIEFDDQGNVLDFLSTEVTGFHPGTAISPETFSVSDSAWNQPASRSWGLVFQQVFSWMLYTTWFQVVVVIVGVASIILWQRFRRKA